MQHRAYKRPIPLHRQFRILFLKWHRAIGIFSAGFMLFLALSGLLLNHGHDLKLDRSFINVPALLSWYGIKTELNSNAYRFKENWVSEQENRLFWNANPVIECDKLQDALSNQKFILTLCNDKIIVLSHQGALVEIIGEFPETLLKIANDERGSLNEGFIHLKGQTKNYNLNLDTLEFSTSSEDFPESTSATTEDLPPSLFAEIQNQTLKHSITWERLLLDLHSGRFFGNTGVIFVDILALLFCFLSITGAWLWLRRH